MAVDTERLRSLTRKSLPFSWRADQSLFYALSVGMGRDAHNEHEHDYLLRAQSQRAMPSMATVMSVNVFEQDYGWNYPQVLHAEQRLKLFRPLTPAVQMLADFTVEAIHDKGVNAPAIIYTRTDVRQAADNIPLFCLRSTLFARADGGFDGPTDPAPEKVEMPTRAPDLSHSALTRPEQSFLYRMNGDYNPLHVDPSAARKGGFERPILHGLCTYGFACKAVLETICGYDHTLIGEFDARFTAPVYPGDTIETHMWQDGERVYFRCVVPERKSTVLDNGYCRLNV